LSDRGRSGGDDVNIFGLDSGEDALALEIGGKFTLLDGAAQLNVAIFRTEFDELQVSTITPQGAATPTFPLSALPW
jgi:outer membrane receptor for monomeric catechols